MRQVRHSPSARSGGRGESVPGQRIARSDAEARLRLGEGNPFGARRLTARAAKQGVGEVLAQFNARLIEGIHAIQLTGIRRGERQRLHQRAQVKRIDGIDGQGGVEPTACGQRPGGGALLDINQFTERTFV